MRSTEHCFIFRTVVIDDLQQRQKTRLFAVSRVVSSLVYKTGKTNPNHPCCSFMFSRAQTYIVTTSVERPVTELQDPSTLLPNAAKRYSYLSRLDGSWRIQNFFPFLPRTKCTQLDNFGAKKKKPFPKSLMQRCRRRRAKDAAATRPHVLGPPCVTRDLGDHRQVRTSPPAHVHWARGARGRGLVPDRAGASFVIAAELSSTDAHVHWGRRNSNRAGASFVAAAELSCSGVLGCWIGSLNILVFVEHISFLSPPTATSWTRASTSPTSSACHSVVRKQRPARSRTLPSAA
jgi:hypothetical protein